MSKLFKLKEWLNIDEAALHFSSAIGETVEKKDIFRLALDGHLTLSVNLVNRAQARRGELVGPDGVVYYDSSALFTAELVKKIVMEGITEKADGSKEVQKSLKVSDELFLNLDDEVKSVGGIWDLSMFGGETLDLEHEYQMLTDGPEVTLEVMDGVILRRGHDACQLVESFDHNELQEGSIAQKKVIEKMIIEQSLSDEHAENLRDKYKVERKEYLENRSKNKNEEDYYPVGALPEDAVYIIKTDEILRFLSSLDDAEKEINTNLGAREKNTLLVLLATMFKQANFDCSQRGISKAIEAATEEMGVRVSDDTIRKILKQIPEALESRQK